jgi:hypothetical protein
MSAIKALDTAHEPMPPMPRDAVWHDRFADALEHLAAAEGLTLKMRFAWLDMADDHRLKAMALRTTHRKEVNQS